MGLLERVQDARPARAGRPQAPARFTFDDIAEMFTYGGYAYPIVGVNPSRDVEDVENSFTGYVQAAYKTDGVIFACMLARQLVFSEARFQWQRMQSGRPGDLFGTPDLGLLETPWPNGTTGELLSRMIQDVDLAGNFYAAREKNRLRRLRPDWVSIILTAPPDQAVQSDVAGYLYHPGVTTGSKGDTGGGKLYLPEEIAHWSPIPDPDAQYRGMSWLTPVLREIQGDKAATVHKLKFYENGATLSTIVSLDASVTKENFERFKAAMDAGHRGVDNAYKTLYVGGGADVTVVGADMRQLDFAQTQGKGETRIAAAARVHPVIVGLSEGLQGSSLNAGNFNSAKRGFADGTLRPLWRSAAAALSNLLKTPAGARLWYDDRDIAFLREDAKDAAEILKEHFLTIESGVRAGFKPETVVTAVQTGDLTQLQHTGLFSVQLIPPTTAAPALPAGNDGTSGDSADDATDGG
jgi:phage portal protein BeeE